MMESNQDPAQTESVPLNSKSALLFLMNYFPTIPDQSGTCKDHSTALIQMINVCYHGAGKAPNFIAVNFYMVCLHLDALPEHPELDRLIEMLVACC